MRTFGKVVAAVAIAATVVVGAPSAGPASAATPTLAQLIGQKLIVRMDGTTPSASLLTRIKAGQIGGVILFGSNITTKTALISLTGKLRAAAVAGGQPKFIIAADQEGGSIKRIPWAPPTMTVPQMGALDSTSTTRSQGASTATALRGLGINMDFAPVADVPASTSSFMYKQGRTWSFSAGVTAAMSDAFATGLESGHVVPSMKHFPGLGYATLNTDLYNVHINVSTAALAPGLQPYRTAISHNIPLIMLSNATYGAYDGHHAAGWSPAVQTLLRTTLGFKGATITDSLTGIAGALGVSENTLAYVSAKAGTDMLLLTGSEASSKTVYTSLLAQATAGSIPRTTLVASYNRILALKSGL